MTRGLFCEVVVVSLEHEVFVDLWALGQEESADFLNLSVLGEELLIFCLCTVLRVVSHQELSQEDARIETLSD